MFVGGEADFNGSQALSVGRECEETPVDETRLHRLTLWCLVLFAAILGSILVARLVGTVSIGESDFNAYWSAGRLFLEGRNPSDPSNMLEMELGHFDPNQEFVMMTWNPPTLWVLMLPVAWMPFGVARSVWLLTNVFLLLVSCLMLRFIYIPGDGVKPILSYLLIASVFPPALLAILAGQVTFLVLFGVTASVFLIKRERWFMAGAVLTLTSVKPHLMMLVGPYLVHQAGSARRQVVAAAAAVQQQPPLRHAPDPLCAAAEMPDNDGLHRPVARARPRPSRSPAHRPQRPSPHGPDSRLEEPLLLELNG